MNIRNYQPPGKMLANIPVASAYCMHAFTSDKRVKKSCDL